MANKKYEKTIKKILQSNPSWLYHDIIIYDEIDSTNKKAKEHAKRGAESGTIILAFKQSQGRGRYDRVWESPPGGLYLTIILRPDIPLDRVHLLSITTSLALADTIKDYKILPSIIWPNDLYINDKKIAGILSELETIDKRIEYVIIGIGLNVNTRLSDYSQVLQPYVTSMLNEIKKEVDLAGLLEKLLHYFGYYYKLLIKNEVNYILERWRGYATMLGRVITVKTPKEVITGRAVDIDQQGFLHVVTEEGEEKIINSGDCVRVEGLRGSPT